MDLVLDGDVQAVVEFMQQNIASGKLVAVAESIPKLARLLWDRFPQEPCVGMRLLDRPITNGLLQDANVSGPALPCAGDGSEVAAGIH